MFKVEGSYEKFKNYLEVFGTTIDCNDCFEDCSICLNSFRNLEGENVDEKFFDKVEEYVRINLEEGTLDPSNFLDNYLSTLFLIGCEEMWGIFRNI